MLQMASPAESVNSGGAQTVSDLVPQQQTDGVYTPTLPQQIDGVFTPSTPTGETYGVLEAAFKRFNHDLFDDVLPPCMIVLNREAGTLGHFIPCKFGEIGGGTLADEIALNPTHFRTDPPRDVLSTIAHELAHCWQYHFGKRVRPGYHDREWAGVMRRIGLQPFSNSDPNKEVGYSVNHRIIDDGPFDRSFKAFEASGQTLRWGDAVSASTGEKKKPKRLSFICPRCAQKVQGIPKTRVRCDLCDLLMVVHDKNETVEVPVSDIDAASVLVGAEELR